MSTSWDGTKHQEQGFIFIIKKHETALLLKSFKMTTIRLEAKINSGGEIKGPYRKTTQQRLLLEFLSEEISRFPRLASQKEGKEVEPLLLLLGNHYTHILSSYARQDKVARVVRE